MTNATSDAALVVPGRTCWQTARADRFATIVDGADYLAHVKAAMLRAKRRIMLIGWDLDYRTAFEPGHPTQLGPNTLGPFLHWLLFREPGVHVYLLKSNLRLLPALDGFWFGVTPVALVNQVTSRRIHFAVDGARPTGAVHHQKIVVVDDDVAFCGGIDLTVGRWDTRDHTPGDQRRTTSGEPYGPRHEVATAVDGAAARVLAEQARQRWQAATGKSLPALAAAGSMWPNGLAPAKTSAVMPSRRMKSCSSKPKPARPRRANAAAATLPPDTEETMSTSSVRRRPLRTTISSRARRTDSVSAVARVPPPEAVTITSVLSASTPSGAVFRRSCNE